ncbi:MAG TPA: sulfatase [Candidatus Binatia bacterium]|nr:sulfatase [Candidatus Binatia bacterium]
MSPRRNRAPGIGAARPWAAAAVLLVLAGVGCRREPPRPPEGVVFVVVDALRADHLGCYGYTRRPTSPHLDALAAGATRFAQAISSTPWTLPSLATMFTSLYPSVHGATLASDIGRWLTDHPHFKPVTVLDESRVTLAEMLRAQGFATGGFVQGSYPAPEFGFGQGFERYDANVHPGIRFNVDALLGWLEGVRPRRFFAYLHVAEVHSPYTPPPPNAWYSTTSPDPRNRAVALALDEERARYRRWDFDPGYTGWLDGTWESLAAARRGRRLDPRDVEHLTAIYDRGIAYADYWIGALLDGLTDRGLLDRTVVVVTSDHGEELYDHGGVEHCRTYYEEMMHVPLIVRVPGLGRGRVVEQEVGLIDLAPTILDLLGVEGGRSLQGRSLVPLIRGKTLEERPVFGEASQVAGLEAVRTEGWTYVHAVDGEERLYDLRADPQERSDICAGEAPRCAALREQLNDHRQAMAAAAARLALPAPERAQVDERTRERLRQLGYAD